MESGLRKHRFNLRISVIFLFINILTDSLVQAVTYRVTTEPEQVTVNEGEKVSLLCRLGVPLSYCRISVPGEEKVLVLSKDWNKNPGFPYFGAGLEKGECGTTIERVSARNHGQVKCDLGAQGEEISGFIDLIVALPPQRPEIEILTKPQGGVFSVDQSLKARCVVRDGRPAANITWFLGDEPIIEGVGRQEVVQSFDRNRNTTLYTATQELYRSLTSEDNGKNLICRALHFAQRGEPSEAKLPLLVSYRPQPLADMKVYGLVLDTTAVINVTIHANPLPRVEWSVDGIVIQQGTQNGRYEVPEPQDIGNGAYNATLRIAGLTLQDTTKDYYLRASNQYGTQDYTIRLSLSDTPTTTSIDIGTIVGICVAVLIIFVAVSLIIFARTTRRWCFAANSSKSPTSETSDTESAEVKAVKSRRLPSFDAIFKKKVDKSKSTPSKQDQEPQNEDEQRLSTVTTEPKDTGNANENEEDKQLVYAELVLKPSEDKPAPPKNSTEYAEIVYIQKSGKDKTEPPKDDNN